MTKVTYKIVQHDGGWAYRVDDVFSETSQRMMMHWLRRGSQPPNSRSAASRKRSAGRMPPANGMSNTAMAATGLKPRWRMTR